MNHVQASAQGENINEMWVPAPGFTWVKVDLTPARFVAESVERQDSDNDFWVPAPGFTWVKVAAPTFPRS